MHKGGYYQLAVPSLHQIDSLILAIFIAIFDAIFTGLFESRFCQMMVSQNIFRLWVYAAGLQDVFKHLLVLVYDGGKGQAIDNPLQLGTQLPELYSHFQRTDGLAGTGGQVDRIEAGSHIQILAQLLISSASDPADDVILGRQLVYKGIEILSLPDIAFQLCRLLFKDSSILICPDQDGKEIV